MAKRTKRLYYGPPGAETSLYWTVTVKDATAPVTINGNVAHALRGYAGSTIGCGLSNMAQDKGNASAFPHPVHFAFFSKTAAWLVDKLYKDGTPRSAVRYEHSYGWVVDANDTGTLKRLVACQPEIMGRPFILRPPRDQIGCRGHSPGVITLDRQNLQKPRAAVFAHRGALARAVKAGRVSIPIAEQMESVAAAK